MALLAAASQGPAQAQSRASTDGRVAVSGHLSSDLTSKEDDLRFWITIENRSDVALSRVHLDRLEKTGFAKHRWCWGTKVDAEGCGIASRPGPSCVSPGGAASMASDEFELCDYLRPHEVVTVWGDLTAKEDLPPHELMALLSWNQALQPAVPCQSKDRAKCPPVAKQPAELTNASLVVSLGRAEPVSLWRYVFRRYSPKADVSIPAALTLLGLFFTWWSGRRQEKNQIWTTMLGKVHEFAMHYYMPMASMVVAAVRHSDTYRKGLEQAAAASTLLSDPAKAAGRRGFYYLMMFHWWRRETFLKVGAYHLRTRAGEDLLKLLARDHESSLVEATEEAGRRLERVKSSLTQETTLDDLLETLDSGIDEDLTAFWSVFENWIKSADCNTHLAVLQAFAAVMEYEVNQVSKDWYAGREKIDLSGPVGTVLRAKGQGSGRIRRYLRAAQYGRRIPVYDWVCDRIA